MIPNFWCMSENWNNNKWLQWKYQSICVQNANLFNRGIQCTTFWTSTCSAFFNVVWHVIMSALATGERSPITFHVVSTFAPFNIRVELKIDWRNNCFSTEGRFFSLSNWENKNQKQKSEQQSETKICLRESH